MTIRENLDDMSSSFNLQITAKQQTILIFLNDQENITQNELNQRINTLEEDLIFEKSQFLNDVIAKTKRRRVDLEKQHKLKLLQSEIVVLKNNFRQNDFEKTKLLKIESIMKIDTAFKTTMSFVLNNVTTDISHSKRSLKLDKIFAYHEKSIKKHRNYVRDLITIFRMILEKFSIEKFKIVFVMQTLIDEFKKIWYIFEKKNSDHELIFQKYCNYLLNFVENSINRHLHHFQLFIDVKQKEKQSIASFDAHLNSLKNHLIFTSKFRELFIYLSSWDRSWKRH